MPDDAEIPRWCTEARQLLRVAALGPPEDGPVGPSDEDLQERAESLAGWRTQSSAAQISLDRVAARIADARHPSTPRALLEIQGLKERLQAEPADLQQLCEMRNWLKADVILRDLCELAEDIRTPLLGALDRLHVALVA